MTDTHPPSLRVAVIGTGFGARVQLPGFMSLADVSLAALCGRRESKTKDIAARFGVKAVYTDYEQMLVDVQPDLVSITAPPHLHNAMAVAALQAGAHVICEKPLAMNVDEAQEMLDVARQHERVHVVDFEFRYLPARYYQRVLVDQGFVGEPLLLEGTLLAPWRWDRDRPWTWWSDKDQGGGVLNALGSHMIDAFRWLTGREVRAVTAVLHTPPAYRERKLDTRTKRAQTSDESAFLMLEMDGNLHGVITLSAVAAGESNRLAIHGTEGALVVRDHLELWSRTLDDDLHPIAVPGEYEPPVWIPDENLLLGPFAKLVGLTIDQIRGHGVVAPPTFEDGIAAQRVLDAAHRSAESGQRVEVQW